MKDELPLGISMHESLVLLLIGLAHCNDTVLSFLFASFFLLPGIDLFALRSHPDVEMRELKCHPR